MLDVAFGGLDKMDNSVSVDLMIPCFCFSVFHSGVVSFCCVLLCFVLHVCCFVSLCAANVFFFWVAARDGSLSLVREIWNLGFLAVCGCVTYSMRDVATRDG